VLRYDDYRNLIRVSNLRFLGRTLRNDLAGSIRFRCWRSSFIPVAVAPSRIDAGVGGEPAGQGKNIELGLGQVTGGDWDLNVVSMETPHTRSLRQRFVDGEAWSQTELWALALDEFSRGKNFDGFRDFDTWRTERLPFVERLAHSLSETGYSRAARTAVCLPRADGRNKILHQAWLDPLCSIGRSGELLAVDGGHRIALSQILELDVMRVHILVRHLDWQLARDSQANYRDIEAAFRTNDGMSAG